MLGLFIQKHALAVSRRHKVSVLYVTSDVTIPAGKIETKKDEYNNINEVRIYFGKYKFPLLNLIQYAKCYLRGIKLLKTLTGQPDLVHVHVLSRTAFPALWLKLFQGIPYIITEHWSRYLPVNLKNGSYRGFFRKLFTRIAVSNAECVTTVTENLASAMQHAGLKNKYIITPNIADVNSFFPESKSPPIIQKLIHVSCFDEPAKNISGIINVIEKLASVRSDFTIEIIGDGKDFGQVKNYAEKTGLVNKRIFFNGLLTGEPLYSAMRKADGLIMFSNYENLPCTIVESIACAVPVISTNVGGISEHLKAGFGILIEKGSEAELASAIEKLLDQPEIFDRKKMREYAVENFSMEASMKQFDSIYSQAVNRNR
jgi:glycosyltransferase involved in cell wall biosynthesis